MPNPLSFFKKFDLTGGYVSAGVAMRNRGYGTISLSGIPQGATVQAAYLYWNAVANSSSSTLAQGNLRTLSGSNVALSGTLIGTTRNPCWIGPNIIEAAQSYSYRADVTASVTGNGEYRLSGFASGITNGDIPQSSDVTPLLEGASLVVVYAHAQSPQTTVTISNGAFETSNSELRGVQRLDGFKAPEVVTQARTTFIGADGQGSWEDDSRFNGIPLPEVGWDGNDPQDGAAFEHGNLWDTMTVDVTTLVRPGDIAATASVVGGNDCLVWVAQVFAIEAPPFSPPPGPDRIPLVFVPGMTASYLNDATNGNEELWLGNLIEYYERLALPDSANENIIASDVFRRTGPLSTDFYGSMLETFTQFGGFKEYDMAGHPERLTAQNCDIERQANPTLFVFPYDWRQDNTTTAGKLKDYVACIHMFYPDSPINVVTHSMGGLIARRYILDNPTQHYVKNMVNIGTPWLGAPKLVNTFENGEFLDLPVPVISHATMKAMALSFPSAHQLAPGGGYFALGGVPLVEAGADIDGDGNAHEAYTFMGYIEALNILHPQQRPANTLLLFRERLGQEDWRGDTSGVQYWNFYGVQKRARTISQVQAVNMAGCHRDPVTHALYNCALSNFTKLKTAMGDGTVPVLSALRQGNGLDYNPHFASLPFTEAEYGAKVEHTALTTIPQLQQLLLALLAGEENRPAMVAQAQQATAELVPDPSRYLSIVNAATVTVSDAAGNSFVVGQSSPLPDVTIMPMGADAQFVILPATGTYDVSFQSLGRPMLLDLSTGNDPDHLTQSTRYNDLTLPLNATGLLQITGQAIVDLQYDADNDGQFEGAAAPTAVLTGTMAADVTPPAIAVTRTVIDAAHVSVELAATDTESGVSQLYYSLDGASYLPYTGTVTIDTLQTSMVYAFADDQAANRSSVESIPGTMISFAGAAVAADEVGGSFPVTLMLDTLSSQPISVQYEIAGGTATAGEDYISGTGTVTFDGLQTGMISLPILHDVIDENDETVQVALRFAEHAGIGQGQATVTIVDNDPIPTISAVVASAGSEYSGFADVTISLSNPSDRPVTVDYTTVDGSALAPGDYAAKSGSVSIPAQSLNTTVRILIADDSEGENSETFVFRLSNPANGVIERADTTLTLPENDRLAFTQSSYSAREFVWEGVKISVRLTAPASQQTKVHYATSNGSASANDYTAASGDLIFERGATVATFTVYPIDDTAVEPDETVLLTLSAPVNAVIVAPNPATLVIQAKHTAFFEQATYTANEESGSVKLVVVVSGPAPSDEYKYGIQFASQDGTAIAGVNYDLVLGWKQFGVTPSNVPILKQEIVITLKNNTVSDTGKTFMVVLSDPSRVHLGTPAVATVTINDTDPVPPKVMFSAAAYTSWENEGAAQPAVMLSAPSSQNVTVHYATSNGTATAGSDYTAKSGTLTFTAGQTLLPIPVTILEDGTMEGAETFVVTLSAPANADLGSPAAQTVTIAANDGLSFSAGYQLAQENAGSATVTVNLNSPSAQTVSVNYATGNGTATAGGDYAARSGTLTFSPGQTSRSFTVPILEDGLLESDETFTLSLSAPTNAQIDTGYGGRLTFHEVTIAANDSLTVSAATQTVQENAGSATVTVNLNSPSAQTVSVNYATGNGTATAGGDYTAKSGTLTFSPGQTSQTIPVAILEDGLLESGETFNVMLSAPTNAGLGSPAAQTVTIAANDSLTVSSATSSVYESATYKTVTVILNSPSAQTVTVNFTTSNGTAKAGSDYTSTSGTLTFTPGQTSRTITVPIIDDGADGESNEFFTLTLSGPINTQLGTPSTQTITIMDGCNPIIC